MNSFIACISFLMYKNTKNKTKNYVRKKLLKFFKYVALKTNFPFSHIIIKTFVKCLHKLDPKIPKCTETFCLEHAEEYVRQVNMFLEGNYDINHKYVFGYLVAYVFKINVYIQPVMLYYTIFNDCKIIYLKNYETDKFKILIPKPAKIIRPHFIKPQGVVIMKEDRKFYTSIYSINKIPLINIDYSYHFCNVAQEQLSLFTISGNNSGNCYYVFVNEDECVGYFNPKTSVCAPRFFVDLLKFTVQIVHAETLQQAKAILQNQNF